MFKNSLEPWQQHVQVVEGIGHHESGLSLLCLMVNSRLMLFRIVQLQPILLMVYN
jgi:hypothetical protein